MKKYKENKRRKEGKKEKREGREKGERESGKGILKCKSKIISPIGDSYFA